MIVTVDLVREYLALNPTDPTSKYSDGTIGSNVRAAQSLIQQKLGRVIENETATRTFTTHGKAIVPVPGLRSASAVTFAESALTVDETYWVHPDAQQSGVYVAVQVRPFTGRSGYPWYQGVSDWWDRGLDIGWRSYGGYSSVPNDLTITGSWGWASVESTPYMIVHAVKVLAAWMTLRPNSLLGNVSISPEGFATTYGALPPEVADAITEWSILGGVEAF